MTYIPDCRVDTEYNQKYLTEQDRDRVCGFDMAVDAIDCFFYNLDVYEEELNIAGEDINLVRFLENHREIADTWKDCVFHWLEKERNGMIVSMIDQMDEEEYENRKAKIEAESEEGK